VKAVNAKNYREFLKRAYNYYEKYGLFRTLRRVLHLAKVKFLSHDLALKGFYLHRMRDHELGFTYDLVFKASGSDYDNWVASLGGPDENARLLMKILSGDGTLVDVGANIGTIAIPVSRSGSNVIAIEMHPENCFRLWVAAVVNGLDHFEIIKAAASDYDGIIEFQGGEIGAHVHTGEGGIPAVCMRLDMILSRYLQKKAKSLVIKIDVEGHELAVLRGSREIISTLRPIVFFEQIALEGSGDDGVHLTKQFMKDAGYALYLMRGRIFSPKEPSDVQEGCVGDYLALPNGHKLNLTTLGYEVRPLNVHERLSWVKEMAEFQSPHHQSHAAGVLLRWGAEEPELLKQAIPIVRGLLKLDHLKDLKPRLERLL
jgi:FkbM family methyltransferase